jgi:hypothetical protein
LFLALFVSLFTFAARLLKRTHILLKHVLLRVVLLLRKNPSPQACSSNAAGARSASVRSDSAVRGIAALAKPEAIVQAKQPAHVHAPRDQARPGPPAQLRLKRDLPHMTAVIGQLRRTDLLVAMKSRGRAPAVVVDLMGVRHLAAATCGDDGAITIGALFTMDAATRDPLILARLPLLTRRRWQSATLKSGGVPRSPAISAPRSPSADMALPPALDARVQVILRGGERVSSSC